LQILHARPLGAMVAAVHLAVGLEAMADDPRLFALGDGERLP
jgi:hypothetical protein